MKAFNGYTGERSQRGNGYPQLPAGPYIGRIMNVKIIGQEPDQSLVLLLDVTEGEHASYYAKRYAHDDKAYSDGKYKDPAKYKGTLYIRIPNPESKKSLYPESDLRIFNDSMANIMSSNPGYTWNWDETTLKGLTVGFSVRQGNYNGNDYTKIYRLEDANDVRMGRVATLAPMAPKSDAAEPVGAVYTPPAYQPPVAKQVVYTEAMSGGFTEVQTDELPFD